MANITRYPNQFFHPVAEPLDSTKQVQTRADLNDFNKVVPYVGQMVHVVNDRRIYICAEVKQDHTGIWRPVIDVTGTCLFMTGADGRLYSITANNGRLEVSVEEAE